MLAIELVIQTRNLDVLVSLQLLMQLSLLSQLLLQLQDLLILVITELTIKLIMPL